MNGAFTDVQVTHAMATDTPPYHHRCWLLNFVLITIWMVLYLFSPVDTTPKMKCGLTTAHFSTLCQSISYELGPREVYGVSGCC